MYITNKNIFYRNHGNFKISVHYIYDEKYEKKSQKEEKESKEKKI
jgi:hypothetical protein